MTNSIRPPAVASLLVKGEAQDAQVPRGMRVAAGDVAGKPWVGNQISAQGRQGVVGDGMSGRFGAVKQGDLCGVRAVFIVPDKDTKSRPHRSQSVRSSEEPG